MLSTASVRCGGATVLCLCLVPGSGGEPAQLRSSHARPPILFREKSARSRIDFKARERSACGFRSRTLEDGGGRCLGFENRWGKRSTDPFWSHSGGRNPIYTTSKHEHERNRVGNVTTVDSKEPKTTMHRSRDVKTQSFWEDSLHRSSLIGFVRGRQSRMPIESRSCLRWRRETSPCRVGYSDG